MKIVLRNLLTGRTTDHHVRICPARFPGDEAQLTFLSPTEQGPESGETMAETVAKFLDFFRPEEKSDLGFTVVGVELDEQGWEVTVLDRCHLRHTAACFDDLHSALPAIARAERGRWWAFRQPSEWTAI